MWGLKLFGEMLGFAELQLAWCLTPPLHQEELHHGGSTAYTEGLPLVAQLLALCVCLLGFNALMADPQQLHTEMADLLQALCWVCCPLNLTPHAEHFCAHNTSAALPSLHCWPDHHFWLLWTHAGLAGASIISLVQIRQY
jgi:hypothetical protein